MYGDTDSVFIESLDTSKIEILIEWAKSELGFDLEIDKTYIWLALTGRKKNYIGLKSDGKVDIKGVVGKKRHTPPFIRKTFSQMIEILKQMRTPEDEPKIKIAIIHLLDDANSKLVAGQVPIEELAFAMGLNKDIEAYVKNVPQHVRVAKQIEGSKAGDIIRFVKTKGKNGVKPLRQASVADVDIAKYQKFMETAFIQVIEALGMEWSEVSGQTKLFI